MDLENIVPTNFIEEEILDDLKNGRIKEVITRCPPEPSGYFHIGHLTDLMNLPQLHR